MVFERDIRGIINQNQSISSPVHIYSLLFDLWLQNLPLAAFRACTIGKKYTFRITAGSNKVKKSNEQ